MSDAAGVRRAALRELVHGSTLAVLWAVFWDSIRADPVLPVALTYAVIFVGVGLGLLVLRRLDILDETVNWEDLSPWRAFLTPFALCLAFGFGLVLTVEVWSPQPEPLPGGYPPGAQPGPPLWFWVALVVGLAAVGVAAYIRSRQPESQLPPPRHLKARLAGMPAGGLAGALVAWTVIAIVGEDPLHSEPLMTGLVLVFAAVIGFGGYVFPKPGVHPSKRVWSGVLALGSGGLLGLALAGVVPLSFELPVAAATVGSTGLALVGAARYHRYRRRSAQQSPEET